MTPALPMTCIKLLLPLPRHLAHALAARLATAGLWLVLALAPVALAFAAPGAQPLVLWSIAGLSLLLLVVLPLAWKRPSSGANSSGG